MIVGEWVSSKWWQEKMSEEATMYRAIEAADGMWMFLPRGALIKILRKVRPIFEAPLYEKIKQLQEEVWRHEGYQTEDD